MDITSSIVITGVAYIKDVKANQVEGGQFTSGSWITRVLNTLSVDSRTNWISLSSNQFTLQPGTYRIEAAIPFFMTDRTKSRLRNITSGTTQLDISGNAIVAVDHASSSQIGGNKTILYGTFSITSAMVFEIQQYAQTTRVTNGLGTAGSDSTDVEVYTQVKIQKVL